MTVRLSSHIHGNHSLAASEERLKSIEKAGCNNEAAAFDSKSC